MLGGTPGTAPMKWARDHAHQRIALELQWHNCEATKSGKPAPFPVEAVQAGVVVEHCAWVASQGKSAAHWVYTL